MPNTSAVENHVASRQDAEVERLREQLAWAGEHDALTRLPNRGAFLQALERHAARVPPSGALLVLDLDDFRSLNDMRGHDAGDRVLAAVAQCVGERLRAGDVGGRLGGDEFAALLRVAGPGDARATADALRRAIAQTGDAVTASIGVVAIDGAGARELLMRAGLALDDAKQAGGDRVATFRGGAGGARRALVAAQLERALEADALAVVAQPIIQLATGSVAGYELLLRLRDPDGRLIGPQVFLAEAERAGRIAALDRWVAAQGVSLLAAGRVPALSVNVSARTLADPGYLAELESLLRAAQLPPSAVTIDLTETTAIADLHAASVFAHRVHELGCRLALDDFGRGLGALALLRRLPFDTVKIDGALVRGFATDRLDRLVVDSLVALAHDLGRTTVGEGAEDGATVDALRRGGVSHAQGWALGRPAAL